MEKKTFSSSYIWRFVSRFLSDRLRKLAAYRSSHQNCAVKKDVLKNFANFTGKHLCWGLFSLQLYWKETFLKYIYFNTYFKENLRTTAFIRILWSVWVFFTFLHKKRPNKCLREVKICQSVNSFWKITD